MEHESTVDTEALTGLGLKAEEIVSQLTQYGGLFIGSLLLIMGGLIAIYLIHKTASKFLFPHLGKGRLIKVTGVTIYSLILLAIALTVLSSIGVDVAGLDQIALVTIFVISVLAFFLLPFLPKLPYKIGDQLGARGELGTVSAISPLFTSLKNV